MLPYITVIGAAVNLAGSISYIKDTLTGKTRPNRVTFLMWSVAPSIGAIAAFSDGVTWAALPVLVSGLIPLMILMASFSNKQAKWQLHWYDYCCGSISLLALILWKVTHQPAIAVSFAIMSDAFAALPTLMKSWTHPETETPAAYAAAVIASATSFLAIPAWRFTEYAFPAYLVMSGLILFLVIVIRRALKSRTFSH